MPVAWKDVQLEEVPDLPATINPEYAILQAIRWNESLLEEQYQKLYTEATLAKILKGNAFAAAKPENDPVKRLARIRRLEASPYYGALQGVRGEEKTILAMIEQMTRLGFVQRQPVSFAASEGEITYLT